MHQHRVALPATPHKLQRCSSWGLLVRTPPMEPHSVVPYRFAETAEAPESTTAQLRARVASVGLEGESRGASLHPHH